MSGMFGKRPRIKIEVQELCGDTALVRITTPNGTLEILGDVSFDGDEMIVTDAHIEGLKPGALRRAGLNEVGEAARERFNVERIVIKGAPRSTGANPGVRPRTIRFPRGS